MASVKYWLWLTSLPGLSPQGVRAVLAHFGTPEGAYFADSGAYALAEGLTAPARRALENKDLTRAETILGRCEELGLRILTLQDADYPERLRQLYLPPAVLYVKGRLLPFDEEVAIAMVGTRECTPYGEKMAGNIAMELARKGAVVVSGIAQGIDTASIRGAIKGGGTVVSVLAGGIDLRYPHSSYYLYDDVAACGALISEYPPGTPHRGVHFPVRNRIISGLSLGVVVVESPLRGGSMLTAEHALEQDRDVFAVPGPADAPNSRGTNALIRQGAAKLVTRGEHILEEYRYRFGHRLIQAPPMSAETAAQRLEPGEPMPPAPSRPRQAASQKKVDKAGEVPYIDWKEDTAVLTDDQRDLLLALEGGSLLADELIERTQIPARRVLSAMTMLQIAGYVTELPGRRFQAQVRVKME